MISDSTTALIIIVILLATFIVFIIEFQEADAIRMDLMGWTLREQPIVCLHDVKEYKYATIKAVHLWNDFTKNPKWHIGVSGNYCNIYVTEVLNIPNGYADAICNSAFCQIRISILYENRTTTDKVRTIAHELGHVFSLGHYPYPDTSEEAIELGACNESIMWMRGACYPLSFPPELLIAMECRHWVDGFGGIIDMSCGERSIRDDGRIIYTLRFEE